MELLSVTMNDGVMPRSEIEGKDNSSEDKSNYKVVLTGDMVYNSMRMWQGANGISPCDGIVSPAYTVLMPKIPISNGYFAAFFKSPNLINEFRKNSQGMTSDTWNLKYPQIETIKVCIPALSEQNRVADMLRTLERRIAKQAQLVDNLKKYKRGVLSVAFGKYGSICSWQTTPYPFAELASRRSEKYDPRSGEQMPCVELEHIEQETGRIIGSIPSTQQNSIKGVSKSGDTLFGKLRPYLRKYAFVKKDMVCSSEIWSLVPSETIIPEYLFYLVQTDEFIKIANISSGTKMPRAEWSNVEKSVFSVPNKEIQAQIVQTLRGLDSRMLDAIDMLGELQLMKEGLLQQLFI